MTDHTQHMIRRSAAAFAGIMLVMSAAPARAETVEIFAAGSLRGVVSELTEQSAAVLNIDVQSSFGGSGSMRERIEKGESPDLLLSADLGSPRKLEFQGRTRLPVIAFARNRVCIISRRSAGITASNLLDQMLDPHIRIKTSTPVVDPSGDYAWAIFDRINSLRPGAGAILKAKAQTLMPVSAPQMTPTQSAAAALFAADRVDLSVTYCSAAGGLQQELPELSSLEVPPELDPHPVYGMAVLSTRPEVLRLGLFLLSEKGQEIVSRAGLLPIMTPLR